MRLKKPESFRKTLCLAATIFILGQQILISQPASISSNLANSSSSQTNPRLSQFVIPSHYDISLEPDLERGLFSGSEKIEINLRQPVKTIDLNSLDLKVTTCKLTASDGKIYKGTIKVNPQAQRVQLTFPQAINPGKCTLHLTFSGILKDHLRGLYRSTYKDEQGNIHQMAVTQMEPTDARRMFPCFDEPAMKAVFKLSVKVDKKYNVISNSPVEKETTARGMKTVVFANTPKMSTYLVALIVGEMDATEAIISEGIPVRVWTTKGKAHLGKFGQDIAVKLLPYFNKYFGTPYCGKKLDLISIPDFEAGAMENLGAITFAEIALLIDDKTASQEAKQRVADIIAHEMAHQWFGDLVTMKWWDDLWLNEAFATWMTCKAIDNLKPEWKTWNQFATEKAWAMDLDSLRSTHAIQAKVNNPAQVNEIFDGITYEKGASVLRMLEQYIGESVFQQGIQSYMRIFAYGNATTADLWNSLGKAAGKDISKLMNTWSNQKGFPVVDVERINSKQLRFSQQRFLQDPQKSKIPTLWQIPLFLKEGNNKSSSILFDKASQTADSKAWFANANGNGFYRVSYDHALLQEIKAKLKDNKLNVLERASFVNDQWALTKSGKLPLSSYLDLTASFVDEHDPSVMESILSSLHQINYIISPEERPAFAKLIRMRLTPTAKRLGWTPKEGEPIADTYLRQDALIALGTIGEDQEVIEKAKQLFKTYVNEPEALHADLHDVVAKIVSYNGNSTDYAIFIDLWRKAKNPEVEFRNLYALSNFQEKSLAQKTLSMSLSKDVRSAQSGRLITRLFHNDQCRYVAWDFVKENWKQVTEKLPTFSMQHLIESTSTLTEQKYLQELTSFFTTHKVEGTEQSVRQALERTKINVNFANRVQNDLKNYLSKLEK